MNMKRVFSVLLCAVVAVAACLPAVPARAADGDTGSPASGVVLSKTVSEPHADGSYTLTLEAFVTGQKVTTEVKTDIPTDIVLVLDQSGSMSDSMAANTYIRYDATTTNSTLYNARYNQNTERNRNLWYKLPDGSYASVSVTRSSGTGYEVYTSTQNSNYYNSNNRNNLYHKVGDAYHKVTVTRSGNNNYTYTYTCGTCGTLATSRGGNSIPDLTLYRLNNNIYQYTYTYTIDGVTTTIGTSVGADTIPSELELYQFATTTTRLNALKAALVSFTDQVEEKAKGPDGILGTEDDVNHRVAVVGFASNGSYDYENSEVFIGADQYNYDTTAASQYANAFQEMDTTEGVNNVNASIGALAASGATCINLGMTMAEGILDANPVNSGETRYRVVIAFTDGQPTTYRDFEAKVASEAIGTANSIKNDGVTVYSVGIFDGADATSAGNSNGTNTEKCNWFMQNLSNNNGSPQNPSYYLSAGDTDALYSIFRQISGSIETGGASSTLTETTEVQDIISDQFALPAGADASSIKAYTAEFNGKNGDQYTFKAREAFSDAEIVISPDGKSISVSNFHYSDNWVGTETAANGQVTNRGKKLIIEIPIVVRPDFLGGNQVATNGSQSGIYIPNAEGGYTNVAYFEVPRVDIALKEVSQPTADQHLYLGSEANLGSLVTEVGDFTVNGVEYTVDGINNSHVDLIYTITDNDGNILGTYTIPAGTNHGSLTDINWAVTEGVDMTPVLTGDVTNYKAYCTVVANPTGIYINRQSTAIDAKVYIYKPELTFADSTVYYGDTTPDTAYFNSTNYKGVVWKNGSTVASAAMGAAPALTLNYTAEGFGTSPTVLTKNDVPVQVKVFSNGADITEYVNFHRDACTVDGCTFNPDNEQFIVHVLYAAMTIVKDYEGMDLNQAAQFTVTTSSGYSTTVVITGEGSATISGLKVGDTVTVTENKGWVWRYTVSNDRGTGTTASFVLDRDSSKNVVTFTNTRAIGKWLSGENFAVNKGGSGIDVTRGQGGPVEPTTPPAIG